MKMNILNILLGMVVIDNIRHLNWGIWGILILTVLLLSVGANFILLADKCFHKH